MAFTPNNLKVAKHTLSDARSKVETLRLQLAAAEADLTKAYRSLDIAIFEKKASTRRMLRRIEGNPHATPYKAHVAMLIAYYKKAKPSVIVF